MDRTLTSFIRALRNADVRVSTAETLDAFNAVELVGYEDRDFLKRSLSLVLPKTQDEKEAFDNCFDQFFSFKDIRGDRESGSNGDGEDADSEAGGEGEGGGAGGEEQRSGKGAKSKGKSKKKKGALGDEEEDEVDLGPGKTSEPTSDLGKLLMTNSRVELSVAMSAAGEAVNLQEIQVFTQKGLFTRRIMEEMGLGELNREISDARDSRAIADRRLSQELRRRRDWLREQVRDYVEQQFLLHADATGNRQPGRFGKKRFQRMGRFCDAEFSLDRLYCVRVRRTVEHGYAVACQCPIGSLVRCHPATDHLGGDNLECRMFLAVNRQLPPRGVGAGAGQNHAFAGLACPVITGIANFPTLAEIVRQAKGNA